MWTRQTETSESSEDVERNVDEKERQDLERIDRLLRESEGAGEQSAEVVAGNPDEMAQFHHEQPDGFSCALAAQESVLEASGKGDYDIEAAIDQGTREGWYSPTEGTKLGDLGCDWERHGLVVDRQTFNDSQTAFSELQTKLNDEKAVVVGIDVESLPEWDGQAGGHALWVTGLEHRPDGYWVICNDSGLPDDAGRRVAYSAGDFRWAWEAKAYSMVSTRDPILKR